MIDVSQAEGKVKKVQLKKFNNRPDGTKEDEPFEVWEGKDEQNMKLIYSKENSNASD